jgi:hypothetical protein
MGLKFALVPYFAMQAAAALTPDIGVPAASAMGLLASLTSTDEKSSLGRVAAGGWPIRGTVLPALNLIVKFRFHGL